MKILTFTTLFPNRCKPDFGIFVKNRMQAVRQMEGVELKVVAPIPWFPPIKVSEKWYAFSQIPRSETIDGIEIYHPRYLVTPKVGMTFYWLWMALGSIATLKKIKKTFDFDLIDAHYIYPDGLAAVCLGRLLGKPVVLSARGTDINLYAGLPIVKHLVRRALQNADLLISVSQSLADLMVAAGAPKERLAVIPNGIDPARFSPQARQLSRDKLGLPPDGRMLLTVGGLVEIKGVHILLDALSLLKRENKLNFITMIVGSGELELLLTKKIEDYGLQDKVTLVGQVPNDRLRDWYCAADLFFLGSSREGWPNVVCEAQACGLPVVATAVNGIPEIVVNEDLGFMVERTAESFAEGISKAMEATWDHARIAQYGQTRTWDNVAVEVFQLLSGLTGNGTH